MPCCGRTPFEVPRIDKMTTDSKLVSCTLLHPDWTECDWHGVWVTDIRSPGSYGRIAYLSMAEGIDVPQPHFWVRWVYNPPDPTKRDSASLVDVEHLKLLPVAPEPWF